jgi:hypothetical protein
MLLYCRTGRYSAAGNGRCSESFRTTVTASVCASYTEAPTSGCIKPTSPTICHSQLSPLRNKRDLMKEWTVANCGQCTVLLSNLWTVYSSVKQFVDSVQFCQAICGQCTVLSSNLWSVYGPVKQFVVNVQFCQATCGQCCWVTKGTDTRSGYAKFISFPGQQFVRIRASVLLYTCITLPVLFKTISKKVVFWETVMGQNRVSLPPKATVSNILRCDKYSVN